MGGGSFLRNALPEEGRRLVGSSNGAGRSGNQEDLTNFLGGDQKPGLRRNFLPHRSHLLIEENA